MSRLSLMLVLVGAVAGCTARIDGSTETSGANPTPGGGNTAGSAGTGPTTTPQTDPNQPPTAQVTCASSTTETVGHRVLRRLTNAELETTIRATFGLDATAWTGVSLPSDAGSLDGLTTSTA